MRRKICIIQPRLHQYRVPFYQKLRDALDRENIECVLIHGEPDAEERKRADEGYLDWAVKIRNFSIQVRGIQLFWQPCLRLLRGADLVVVQQENRMLLNYLLMLNRLANGATSSPRLCFWGHGVNCQAETHASLRERWKRALIRQADWWFAYTDFTRDILSQARYPKERITVVQNAIDTAELRAHADSIGEAELQAYREQLGIRGRHVGVYCSSLYRRKRIDFMLHTAQLVRARFPDFELVVIGSGPDDQLVRDAAAQYPWIHFLGARFGRAKALALRLGQVFLMPRLVGLSILDAFAIGQPLLAVKNGFHGPEISYLRNGVNGCLTEDDTAAYAAEVGALLHDRARLAHMRENCLRDAERFTIEAMVDHFSQGILGCLHHYASSTAYAPQPMHVEFAAAPPPVRAHAPDPGPVPN